MAATDLLVEVGDPGSATTLSSPGYTSGSSTSINVASTSNWPSTGKAVIFAIDEAEVVDGEEVQVAGTYNEYEGTVASATSVSNVAWQRGSGDRNYSAGSLTRVYIPVSAERENRLVEWGEHEHDVNGNHDKELITDRTADTSPASDDLILTSDTSASGALKKVTIANAKSVEVADSIVTNDITDDAVTFPKIADGVDWTSFTPSWNDLTAGNGTNEAEYARLGDIVWVRGHFIFGSTSSISLSISHDFPVTPHAQYDDAQHILGMAHCVDANGNLYPGQVRCFSVASGAAIDVSLANGTYLQQASLNTSVPFTWTTSDSIVYQYWYRAA